VELKNCQECGRVFVHPSRDLCQNCYDAEELDFNKVKEFLWNKMTSSVDEVSEMTGVSTKRVIKFIREGRFNLSGLRVDLTMPCEGCGEPITEGRFCRDCRDRIIDNLSAKDSSRQEYVPEPEPEPKTKSRGIMFTAERHKRR
jgi:flagellar operon protein (TIGR03826 family)